jgi:hypothetical protein
MARETTYSGMMGSWQRLLETLEANGADLPQLQPFRTKLEGLLAQALEINRRQAELTAEKQAASKRMREVASQAQRLETAMRGLIKEHYGIREEKLAAFGLQPFRGRKPAPPAPEPGPAPRPSAAADSVESDR